MGFKEGMVGEKRMWRGWQTARTRVKRHKTAWDIWNTDRNQVSPSITCVS